MSQPVQQDVYGELGRPAIRPFIPSGARTALDVGCGRGGFASDLRAVLGASAALTGVEPTSAAAYARDHSQLDEVVEGYFPDALDGQDRTFDLISFNDVLEHLVDPWTALEDTKRFLSPNGVVLASIPSIQYAPALLRIARGDFPYEATGTFDRTHLRWFTRSSMIKMFEGAGYEVLSIDGIYAFGKDREPRMNAATIGMLKAARRIAGAYAWRGFVVIARPRVADAG